ncbi:gamma-butyrolactone-binding regulator SlbR [Streptomyces thermocarboxydovorans]|uniref:Gamma-butyrolactone-binding regulator SlbR n=1 Tax=Streptomyces thermocarboxydovorans TaxID=59298 RepID=A0ABP3SLA5_9ACTN
MSDNAASVTDLTSQYTAQVASDLERNVKEQERVSAEIAALQEQLAMLRRDHAVLVNMRQALESAAQRAETDGGGESGETSEEPAGSGQTAGQDPQSRGAKVPAPRRKSGAKAGAGKQKRAKRASSAAPAAARKPARKSRTSKAEAKAKTEAASRTESAAKAGGPRLVDLVRQHLAEQQEPRSAAEIATALGQAHPGRSVKTTVVRNTLEALVARNQAQRSKQGTSVFYTAPGTGSVPAREEASAAS